MFVFSQHIWTEYFTTCQKCFPAWVLSSVMIALQATNKLNMLHLALSRGIVLIRENVLYSVESYHKNALKHSLITIFRQRLPWVRRSATAERLLWRSKTSGKISCFNAMYRVCLQSLIRLCFVSWKQQDEWHGRMRNLSKHFNQSYLSSV